MPPAYQQDLAYIHDAGFSNFAKRAGTGILQTFRQHNLEEGLVIDLGCGSGTWAQLLLDSGFNVLGIDISSAMIALAREKAPAATFLVDSFFNVDFPDCKAVTSIGECINYLFDDANTPFTLQNLFGRVYNALERDGLFIFDIIEPGYGEISGSPKRHFCGPDWAVLVEIQEDTKSQLLTRTITAFRKLDDLYRRSDEVHQVRLYDGNKIQTILEKTGFTVARSREYPDFPLSAAHSVFIARKP